MLDYFIKSQDEEYASKHQIRSGVGLSAPQIGLKKKMLAIYFETEDKIIKHALVNPKIISNSTRLIALSCG